MQHRDKRVADAIRETVAEIVLNEISDPKVGFVTVTRCRITRDLRVATVFFSIMGDEKQQKEALAHLQHAKGFIRKRLGEKVKFRYLPDLHFALDEILAQEMRISEIISDMHHDEPPEPAEES